MKKLTLILLLLLNSLTAALMAQTPVKVTDSMLVKKHQDSIIQAKRKADALTPKGKVATPVVASGAYSWEQFTEDARPVVGWILIIGIVILFFWIAYASQLLRDSIMDPAAFMALAAKTTKYLNVTDINKVKKPYSLARSQLGIWTVVIGCSYIYLEMCRCYPTHIVGIDKTLLGLMGISAATTAAGNLIDNNATAEQQGAVGPSEGFFKDILSDQNGINIHRFQNVVWTLIAVSLYLSQIPDVICGHLPTLDSTLVSLTAISSATYLGLKINENKPPAIPTTPAANP